MLIAVPIGYFATLYMTWKAGHGDSREPEHVALQTRQDVGGVYSALFVTNALPKARTIPRSPVAASPRLPRASAWHVQLFTSLAVIAGIKELVLAALVPVALDHFGGAQVALGPAALRGSRRSRALRRGPCENFRRLPVILAGADYPDVASLAKALIAANPQRVVWGSDWPHTNSTPPGRGLTDATAAIDDGCLLNQLPGPRRGGPQGDPGRQSGATLWLLSQAAAL